jgi:hypothetical protein
MNYFAHALRHLDRPHFAVGTAVPDWLSVADRRVRLRTKQVEPFLNATSGLEAEFAAGVLQHLRDDARFHETRAFAEASLELSATTRDALDGETGLRPAFLGHLLVEILLDASLIVETPAQLDEYYRMLDAADAAWIETTVNSMANRTTNRLAIFVELFRRERVLWDYLEDGKLMRRLNQVMRRVRLAELPDNFAEILPAARKLISRHRDELLTGIV